jgi:hypothetical protein
MASQSYLPPTGLQLQPYYDAWRPVRVEALQAQTSSEGGRIARRAVGPWRLWSGRLAGGGHIVSSKLTSPVPRRAFFSNLPEALRGSLSSRRST